jgi:aminopeptidase N
MPTNKVKFILIFILSIYAGNAAVSQTDSRSPFSQWWDLLYYDLRIAPDFNTRFITGTNDIAFQVLQANQIMQIDLEYPMMIMDVKWHGQFLKFERKNNLYFLRFPENLPMGQTDTVHIEFEGNPQIAVHPPWGNGWTWEKDNKGRPWMSVTCEGSGPSIWFPCKNQLSDEPDHGVSLSITVPDTLVAVGNGRLQNKSENKNGTVTYTWVVVSTINNYDIIPYIGKYVTWHEDYMGEKGRLDCDYWVLDYNLNQAKRQFRQVDSMLHCFESWCGPYPFYEDSYKLVEAPYPGMEHQSAIAYGNGFKNGFNGRDLSGTGWGLKWDFILVHESAHEWFGNSITAGKDGESWIHEGFAKYMETIYTGYISGLEAGNDYSIGIWKRIRNDEPILGSGSSDSYNKASAMLHMIKRLLGDAEFRQLLRALNKTFYHQTVTTSQILNFFNQFTHRDFSKIFDQYLRTTVVPVLEYDFGKTSFAFRWSNCVEHFNMPIQVSLNGQKDILIRPTTQWQIFPIRNLPGKTLIVDRNFYVRLKMTDGPGTGK